MQTPFPTSWNALLELFTEDLQTLSMAGVPWYFDSESNAYRIRAGFKFPALSVSAGSEGLAEPDSIVLIANAKKIVAEGERFLGSLKKLIRCLEGLADPSSK